MTGPRSRGLAGLMLLGFCLALGWAQGAPAKAMHFKAQLIWGTDGPKPQEKPEDKELRELDPVLLKKLKGVFRWKNYFEVERKIFSVPDAETKRVRISPKCEIELTNLRDSQIEVRLFGQGKLVVRKRQKIQRGEILVLAGDDKNQTAWFVILSLADPREAEKQR